MAKLKRREISRRSFLGKTIGAAVVAGVGCGDDGKDKSAGDAGPAGADGTTGTGGATGNTAATSNAGMTATGGSATGGTSTAIGGASGGASGAGTGGVSSGGSAGSESGDNPLVALVRGSDWAQAVRDAIDLVGGLPDLSGLTVLLKPNVISTNPAPETTDAEVVRGAIQAVKARGAATVVVAEDGFAGDTLANMEATGIAAVCSQEGAEAVQLRDTPVTSLAIAAATAWSGAIDIYERVYNADYVINMPVCKSHGLAIYSMALKNWYGCIRSSDRTHTDLANRLAELHLAKQEHFVILDATKAMVTGGPQRGETAESRVVVASRDAIAADVTGLCIHKQYGTQNGGVYNLGVWDQGQVTRAMQLQLPGWLSSRQNFAYAQQGVDDHAEIMAWRDA